MSMYNMNSSVHYYNNILYFIIIRVLYYFITGFCIGEMYLNACIKCKIYNIGIGNICRLIYNNQMHATDDEVMVAERV